MMIRRLVSRRFALIASGALVVPLFAAPPVYANDAPSPEVNAATAEESNTAGRGAEGPRRGNKIVNLTGGTCPTTVPKGFVRLDIRSLVSQDKYVSACAGARWPVV